MQDPHWKNGEYRQLRAITFLDFFFGFSLLLPHGVNTGRPFPVLGIMPLFFSALSGGLIYTGRLQLAGKKALVDLLLSAFYVALLVPSWFEIEDRGNQRWVGGGETMVATYGTAVMMLNFVIHVFFCIQAVRIGDLEIPTIVWKSRTCHDCQQHHHHHHRSVSVAGHRIGFSRDGMGVPHEHRIKDVHQPFMQSSDEEEARESSEYQTSGFNSPRRSAETLATDFHTDFGDA